MNQSKSPLPNFFIVGAAKAGTSTLWQYLNAHHQVFMPEDELFKEPRYFNNPKRFKSFQHYLNLFKDANANHLRIGEASTAYLSCQECPEKIKSYATEHQLDVKILIMLRNPADRAYSLYNWMVQDGYEYSATFEKALAREKRRKVKSSKFWEPNNLSNYLYFDSGCYSAQVQRYISSFGSSNVYVAIFEEFVKDPEQHLQQIYTLLGLDANIEVDVSQVFNPSYQVKAPFIQFSLRKLTKILTKARLLKYDSKDKRDRIMNFGFTKNKPPKLDRGLRQALLQRYQLDIKRLEKILGRSMDIWYSK